MSSNNVNYLIFGNIDFFCPQMNPWSFFLLFFFWSRQFLIVANEDFLPKNSLMHPPSLTFCICATNYFNFSSLFSFCLPSIHMQFCVLPKSLSDGARAVSPQITANSDATKSAKGQRRSLKLGRLLVLRLIPVHMDEREKNFPPCAETWSEKDSADSISEDYNCFKDCPVFR